MKIRGDYPSYKTIRQWALQGYLPNPEAKGIELWANRFCQDKFIYYSPDEVTPATAEQLDEYFRPERERRSCKAKVRREQQRSERLAEIEREVKREQQEIISAVVKPYLERISELHRIIKAISASAAPSHGSGLCLIIDTETTGLDPERDELLQVSIIDVAGNTLFDSYFKPCVRSWKSAERVNGISPEMVKDAPTISEKVAEINAILCRADQIIGYNTHFDIDFLRNNGVMLPNAAEIVDVMSLFAPVFGEWSDYYGDYKWQTLSTEAGYYKYNWNGRAHNSLADCFATLYVYNKIKCAADDKKCVIMTHFD